LYCDLTLQYEKQSLKLMVTSIICIDLQLSAVLEQHNTPTSEPEGLYDRAPQPGSQMSVVQLPISHIYVDPPCPRQRGI